MSELTKTMKLHIHPDKEAASLFQELTSRYSAACNFISEYIFHHGYILNFMDLQKEIYSDIRDNYGLKSQMSISAIKTVTARYKTVKEQLLQKPYRYKDENGTWQYITRSLEWLTKPASFCRPQADLVRGRDYSFVDGGSILSLNTLGKRVKVSYDIPDVFAGYFDGSWSFGTGKLVSLNGKWYFHIPVTKEVEEADSHQPSHVVGIDRGLRFLVTAYDEKEKTTFIAGDEILRKRETFNKIRAELQARGTKSAKRALKRISGRENRWMSDVNHQISKTLTDRYGSNTLYVIEDLTGVSFSEGILSSRNAKGRNETRSWAFYQASISKSNLYRFAVYRDTNLNESFFFDVILYIFACIKCVIHAVQMCCYDNCLRCFPAYLFHIVSVHNKSSKRHCGSAAVKDNDFWRESFNRAFDLITVDCIRRKIERLFFRRSEYISADFTHLSNDGFILSVYRFCFSDSDAADLYFF